MPHLSALFIEKEKDIYILKRPSNIKIEMQDSII